MSSKKINSNEINSNEMQWIISSTNSLNYHQDAILKMYKNSYKNIGVIDFGGWNGLKSYYNCSCYLLVTSTNDIKGVILYWLSDYGNKISLVISQSKEIGKIYVVPKLIELLKTSGFYVELSDTLEYLVRKELDNIKDIETIKMLIDGVTEEDIFTNSDPRRSKYKLGKNSSPIGSYLRVIKNLGPHRKALYGLPCLGKKFNKNGCNRKCNNTLL